MHKLVQSTLFQAIWCKHRDSKASDSKPTCTKLCAVFFLDHPAQ